MKVFSYFEPLPGNGGGVPEVITFWRASWTSWGWDPVLLGAEFARQHPKYLELCARLDSLPLAGNRAWQTVCFTRWCAAAMFAPCWFGDWDVLNYGFIPQTPRTPVKLGSHTAYSYTTRERIDRLIDLFLNLSPSAATGTFTDVNVFLSQPEILGRVEPIEALANVGEDWLRAPLVHFCNHYKPAGIEHPEWMRKARPGWVKL